MQKLTRISCKTQSFRCRGPAYKTRSTSATVENLAALHEMGPGKQRRTAPEVGLLCQGCQLGSARVAHWGWQPGPMPLSLRCCASCLPLGSLCLLAATCTIILLIRENPLYCIASLCVKVGEQSPCQGNFSRVSGGKYGDQNATAADIQHSTARAVLCSTALIILSSDSFKQHVAMYKCPTKMAGKKHGTFSTGGDAQSSICHDFSWRR
jgi:hypothetical protein